MSEGKALATMQMSSDGAPARKLTIMHVALGVLVVITTISVVLDSITLAKIPDDTCDLSTSSDMTTSIDKCLKQIDLKSEHMKYYLQTKESALHFEAPSSNAMVNSTHRMIRRLDTLESIVEIGEMIGATWNAVSGNGVSINTNKWTGAVPASMSNDWESLSGWKSYYWKFASLSCQNGFGATSVSMDLSISFDYNYQFIKNAKVGASGSTIWGQSVSASVSVGSPVNIGTSEKAIAQIPLYISVGSSNILQSSTKQYTLLIKGGDASGGTWYPAHQDNSGSFC